jgi:hypothetical protein
MLVKACDAMDIIELNKKKEYTLTATCILESVLTNPKLNAQAVKLWQLLFNKARFHSNLEIKICYNELAKNLHRSSRSISRYVRTLVQEGYLLLDENYNKDGSQQPNTLYIRIPQIVVEDVKNKKDRVVNKAFFSPANNESPPINEDTRSPHKETTDSSPAISNKFHTDDMSLPVNMDYIATDSVDTTSQNPRHVENGLENYPSEIRPQDKIVMGADDKSVVHKDSIKKHILINNNVVVPMDTILAETTNLPSSVSNKVDNLIQTNQKSEKTVLRGTDDNVRTSQDIQDKEEIKKIDAEIKLLYIKMGSVTATEKVVFYEKIRHLQATVSTISVIMNQRIQSTQPKNTDTSNTVPTVNPNVDFSKVLGDRELSIAEINKIKAAIETQTNNTNEIKRTCNEIIYAIRFGTLKTGQNGNILSINHAISIALKLLRENRWETPALLKIKETSNIHFKKSRIQPPITHIFTGQQHISALLNQMRTA